MHFLKREDDLKLFEFQVKKMNEFEAKIITSWIHISPYDCYNYPSWKYMSSQNWFITDEIKRGKIAYSVYKNSNLVGGIYLIKSENDYLLGLDLKPEFCGKGLGKTILNLSEKILQHEKNDLVLKVREFNKRAIKCYLNYGFTIEKKFVENNITFYLMRLKR